MFLTINLYSQLEQNHGKRSEFSQRKKVSNHYDVVPEDEKYEKYKDKMTISVY